MKKMKVVLSLALTAAVLANCVTAVQAKDGKTLTVGVRDDIMNFGYYNETTEKYYGLEIDLAEKLADDLGYDNVEFVTVQPENRKEKLLAGEIDCIIAAYTISDTRLENFDFSPAYYNDYSMVMVEKSSLITDFSQLSDKKIGVLDGADAAPIFVNKMEEEQMVPEGEFVRVSSYSELSQALEEGLCDAAVMDGCVAKAYMDDDRMLLETTLQEENYGVATPKGSELSEKVSESIQKMLDDGTIAELTDKWD